MVKRYLGGIISAILPSTTTTSASGMYNATSATQLKQAGNWPSAPNAPTGVSAVPGNATATITFTPPVNNGGSAITLYTVVSSPENITATGSNSPITVTGLTNGTAYTFTVTATNVLGNSVSSSASNSVTPSAFDFQITPAVGGVTDWVFAINGSLSIATAGEYTILWGANSSKVVKMWGGGGRPNSAGSTGWGAGGAGGAAVGTVAFTQGTTYILRVGGAGANGTAPANAYGAGNSGGVFTVGTAGSGGGYTGLFSGSVSQANAVLMAGGGGGGASDRSDGLGGRSGYAGGGTTGASGGDFVAGSGTQSAGGSAAGAGSPTSGAALQGGNGSNGGAGGGGGYFGGGGGGSQGDGGYGGGGGSGYFKPSDVTSTTLYTGSGTVAGNNSDADKPTNAGAGNTAGSASFPGAFIIKA